VENTLPGLISRLIEREGATGALVTTTSASLHAETETQLLSVSVCDEPEQTKGIPRPLVERVNGRGPTGSDLSLWHGLQMWLDLEGCREVIIAYAY